MFKLLPVKPDIDTDTRHRSINKAMIRPYKAPTLLAAALTGVLLVSSKQKSQYLIAVKPKRKPA